MTVTKYEITHKPVPVNCPKRCRGVMFAQHLSRLEEGLGHEGYKCDKCGYAVKYVPKEDAVVSVKIAERRVRCASCGDMFDGLKHAVCPCAKVGMLEQRLAKFIREKGEAKAAGHHQLAANLQTQIEMTQRQLDEVRAPG